MTAATSTKESRYNQLVQKLPWQMDFVKSGVRLSVLMPLVLGVFVGILAAIMGVGGGFIMVPVMVYLLRMPMHVVVGTSLFQILFTCVNVTIMQAHTNHNVDFILALILLLGSTLGAQVGAKISKTPERRPTEDPPRLPGAGGDGQDAPGSLADAGHVVGSHRRALT